MWPSGAPPLSCCVGVRFWSRSSLAGCRLGQCWLVRASVLTSKKCRTLRYWSAMESRAKPKLCESFVSPLPHLTYSVMSPFASTSGTLFRSRNSCSATSTTCVTAYPFLLVNQLRRLEVFTRIRVLSGSLAGPRFGSRLVVTAEVWRAVAGAAEGV